MSGSTLPTDLAQTQCTPDDKALAETFLKVYLSTYDKQHDYGKWVLASLLAVHAGSLLAISQAGEAAPHLFHASGDWLVYGIGMTMIAGGLAWINFTFAAFVYHRSYFSLREGGGRAKVPVAEFFVNATLWAAPTFAIASLALFFIAAWKALQVL